MSYKNEVEKKLLDVIMEEVNTISYRERKSVEQLLEDNDNKFRVGDALVNTLYKLSMSKYENLDLSSIEKSKGDISKFEGYETMKAAIKCFDEDFSKSISSLKDNDLFLDQIKVAKETMYLLEAEKRQYELAYSNNINIIQISYSTVVMSLLLLLNLMVSEAIHVMTTCNNSVFNYPAGLKETKDFVVYQNLKKYNDSVKSGTLDKIIKTTNNTLNESFLAGTAIVVGITTLVFLLVKAIRALIYSIYNIRLSVYDYLTNINEYLETNKYNINSNKNLTPEKKKHILNKQKKTMERLNKLINIFELKFVRADKKTKIEINKKVQVQEMRDNLTNVSSNVNTFSLI